MHPGRRHVRPHPFARNLPVAQHAFDGLPTRFSRSRSEPTLTNILAGRMRMYWKNDSMPPGFSSLAYACKNVAHVVGREIVERQPGNDEIELPFVPELLHAPLR